MYSCFTFFTSDGWSLARTEYSTMSDQTLTELVVLNIHDKAKFTLEDGTFKDVQNWRGVMVDVETQRVVAIKWDYHVRLDAVTDFFTVGDPLQLEWLPPNLTSFSVKAQRVSGTVQTDCLPRVLEHLDLSYNNGFHGPFDIQGLPAVAEVIDIGSNEFSGKLDLSALPRSMRCFVVCYNAFSGTLDLSCLPSILCSLNVANNRFTGSIDLGKLPQTLKQFRVNDNQIVQETVVIRREDLRHTLFHLQGNDINKIVDDIGRELNMLRIAFTVEK